MGSYQGDGINFINENRDHLGFAICKATEGITYIDSKFRQNWDFINSEGLIRGAYHFYIAIDNPDAQADLFVKMISNLEDSDLPPIIDFESAGLDKSQTVNETQYNLTLFLKSVESKLNRKPIILTDIPTANKYLNDDRFSEYALWIADYSENDTPNLPTSWKNSGWTFWQRDATYKIDNFTDHSDVFNGDINELKDFIKIYK